ncbi:formate dehydrogenase accessory sulfurtransferase FdhD [uncultured Amnibacterium sp.]|uniref:formate dehydrogenase accessory sulfurtransferase FdhD n=1 Tax=uncultured Amnibacterium sp. TaxID=1631851 RepID=UPI0035CB88D6
MRTAARRRVEVVGSDGDRHGKQDALAREEPLEIRIGGNRFSVTMRTPGDDFDLVAGFLVSEGIVAAAEELPTMRVVSGIGADGDPTFNVIDAAVTGAGVRLAAQRARTVYTTSACGVCGLASIDAVRTASAFPILPVGLTVPAAVVAALPDRLREAQRLFDTTGGVHAAGLFDAEGRLLVLREDVGRHNAVDKVVGWALREGRLPLTRTVLQVSGRASFELVQKARMAGIPLLAAVSAPSSLAAELAEDAGITLVGFSRGTSFNVYAHGHRITV